jgi:hypothetical protein
MNFFSINITVFVEQASFITWLLQLLHTPFEFAYKEISF